MRVLIISDTHGNLPKDLGSVAFDAMLHAGDIGDRAFYARLAGIAGGREFRTVCGNTDFALADYLPATQTFELDGMRFFLVHNLTSPHRMIPANAEIISRFKPRFVVFGHTHKAFVERRDGVIFINPGTFGKEGLDDGRRSYAILEAGAEGCSVSVVDLDTNEVFVRQDFELNC